MSKHVTIYNHRGKPMASTGGIQFSRKAASTSGAMGKWNPTEIFSEFQRDRQKELLNARSTELVENDPNSAAIAETFCFSVAGRGLIPHPSLDYKALGISKKKSRKIQRQQHHVFNRWWKTSDTFERWTFGEQVFQMVRQFVQYGEFFCIVNRIADPFRPYSLSLQLISPERVSTPTDLRNKNIHQGIELSATGKPVAIWVKKAGTQRTSNASSSANYQREVIRQGHWWRVIHQFLPRGPEDLRGTPLLAPSMKYSRDLADLLSSELMSNLVTAALALFIENQAGALPGAPGNEEYDEIPSGGVMYGSAQQKPHLLSPSRPGATFDDFVRLIKKGISASAGLPYNVAFKDMDKVTFAGFRSAMLEAWRVFSTWRTWLSDGVCSKAYTMLLEEAWCKKEWGVGQYIHNDLQGWTSAEWYGPPKGDIEPFKAAKADELMVSNHSKTQTQVAAENGNTFRRVVEGQAEENEIKKENGVLENGEQSNE